MRNSLATQSVSDGNIFATETVTARLANTHCTVCGTAFETRRSGKLYCSPKCKQFAFNHKSEISDLLSSGKTGQNEKRVVLFIDDYLSYDRLQRLLKLFKELRRKKLKWEGAEQQLKINDHYGVTSSNLLWSTYVKEKLTEEEEGCLYNAETLLDDQLHELTSKHLSIEQWSFIKKLYFDNDDLSFFQIVCSFSMDFIQRLSLDEDNNTKKDEYSVIKARYIYHCNLIASGVIKFEKREQTEA
jgi:hypothetical protein